MLGGACAPIDDADHLDRVADALDHVSLVAIRSPRQATAGHLGATGVPGSRTAPLHEPVSVRATASRSAESAAQEARLDHACAGARDHRAPKLLTTMADSRNGRAHHAPPFPNAYPLERGAPAPRTMSAATQSPTKARPMAQVRAKATAAGFLIDSAKLCAPMTNRKVKSARK